jgi:hypothetical protein
VLNRDSRDGHRIEAILPPLGLLCKAKRCSCDGRVITKDVSHSAQKSLIISVISTQFPPWLRSTARQPTPRAGVGRSSAISRKTSAKRFYAPGASEATFIGPVVGSNEYFANLTQSGKYRVRVYLMRNAARRNEHCKFSITFEISG